MLEREQSLLDIEQILQIDFDNLYDNSSPDNYRIIKAKSAPKLKSNFNNDSSNSYTNKSTRSLNPQKRDSSSEIRMLYDYYYNHPNLKLDDSTISTVNVDRYGFVISGDKSKVKEKRHKDKEEKRSLKWFNWISWVSDNKIAEHFGFSYHRSSKFLNRIGKGIPDSWRSSVWHFLVADETEFDDNLVKSYKDLLKLPSTHEKQIDLDIPRTLHSHIMFRTRYGPGQRALFNVLRAFSNYDKQVGYCQGMSNIVTILLMYYTEENAFVMLIKLFTKCNLHDLYVPGFPALIESFYVQEKLMNIYAHKISNHFKKLQISSTAYSTRWYITLFSSDVVPHHTVLRIWDLLLLHGFDILYFVTIALLKYNESFLLSSDFDCILTMLSSSINIDDDDKLTRKIVKLYNKKERERLIDTFKTEYSNQCLINLND